MNDIILNTGDKDIYEVWFYYVPDGACLEDFVSIAEDDILWFNICKICAKLMDKIS